MEVVDRFDQNDLVSVGEGYHSRMSVQILRKESPALGPEFSLAHTGR